MYPLAKPILTDDPNLWIDQIDENSILMPLLLLDNLLLAKMQEKDDVLDSHIQNIPFDHASIFEYFHVHKILSNEKGITNS